MVLNASTLETTIAEAYVGIFSEAELVLIISLFFFALMLFLRLEFPAVLVFGIMVAFFLIANFAAFASINTLVYFVAFIVLGYLLSRVFKD